MFQGESLGQNEPAVHLLNRGILVSLDVHLKTKPVPDLGVVPVLGCSIPTTPGSHKHRFFWIFDANGHTLSLLEFFLGNYGFHFSIVGTRAVL